MAKLSSLLREHMHLTCKDIGLELIWDELERCNWLDRGEGQPDTKHQDVLSSFESMRRMAPKHEFYEMWVADVAKVLRAVSVMKLFGYDFEADWLSKRAVASIENRRRSEQELLECAVRYHGKTFKEAKAKLGLAEDDE